MNMGEQSKAARFFLEIYSIFRGHALNMLYWVKWIYDSKLTLNCPGTTAPDFLSDVLWLDAHAQCLLLLSLLLSNSS